ncbi:MAG TPA: integrin alpha, partial [Rhizomicrobium sp.]|nr:integrin alpha [Rhizomicrobium sp.]
MSLPLTKVFLASAVSGTGGFRFHPNASGDLNATVTGSSAAPWISGIADLNGDLIPDLIMGAPGDDDKFNNAGRIFVSFGSAAGSNT